MIRLRVWRGVKRVVQNTNVQLDAVIQRGNVDTNLFLNIFINEWRLCCSERGHVVQEQPLPATGLRRV